MSREAAWLESGAEGEAFVLRVGGRWDIAALGELDERLRRIDPGPARRARIDLGAIEALDTASAWAIHRTWCRFRDQGLATEYLGAGPAETALLARLERCPEPQPMDVTRPNPIFAVLERVGRGAVAVGAEARDLLAFIGLVAHTALRTAVRPRRMRVTSFTTQVERAGLNALPIVGLLTFLIGIVLAYQGADQLRRFGAEIFTVNLLGISILREIGVLITAILIAGRSGSAFAAQIGTMKVNQEIDAMRTLGLDPVEILVLPRILALMLVLPLLTFYADIMGLFGGGVMAMAVLDMSPDQFLRQLSEAVPMASFWVGMVKAPVFGLLIALMGCYQGLKVTGSAESVGRKTTQSVVEAIFLVIVFDAIFSIMFSYLGI